LKTIYSPSNSYEVLCLVEEEVNVTVAQTTIEETNGSPNEDIQQSTKIGTPNKTQRT
jgi:hypothetical protein